MKKRGLEKRVGELERRMKAQEAWRWRFIPSWPSYPRHPEPCCPYLDKCTACPHRCRITWDWRDNSTWIGTDTDTWTSEEKIQVTYTNPYSFNIGAV